MAPLTKRGRQRRAVLVVHVLLCSVVAGEHCHDGRPWGITHCRGGSQGNEYNKDMRKKNAPPDPRRYRLAQSVDLLLDRNVLWSSTAAAAVMPPDSHTTNLRLASQVASLLMGHDPLPPSDGCLADDVRIETLQQVRGLPTRYNAQQVENFQDVYELNNKSILSASNLEIAIDDGELLEETSSSAMKYHAQKFSRRAGKGKHWMPPEEPSENNDESGVLSGVSNSESKRTSLDSKKESKSNCNHDSDDDSDELEEPMIFDFPRIGEVHDDYSKKQSKSKCNHGSDHNSDELEEPVIFDFPRIGEVHDDYSEYDDFDPDSEDFEYLPYWKEIVVTDDEKDDEPHSEDDDMLASSSMIPYADSEVLTQGPHTMVVTKQRTKQAVKKKRITKTRLVPQETMLSFLREDDEFDLDDDEFNLLLQDLEMPAMVEEDYSDYVYDEVEDDEVEQEAIIFLPNTRIIHKENDEVYDEYESDSFDDEILLAAAIPDSWQYPDWGREARHERVSSKPQLRPSVESIETDQKLLHVVPVEFDSDDKDEMDDDDWEILNKADFLEHEFAHFEEPVDRYVGIETARKPEVKPQDDELDYHEKPSIRTPPPPRRVQKERETLTQTGQTDSRQKAPPQERNERSRQPPPPLKAQTKAQPPPRKKVETKRQIPSRWVESGAQPPPPPRRAHASRQPPPPLRTETRRQPPPPRRVETRRRPLPPPPQEERSEVAVGWNRRPLTKEKSARSNSPRRPPPPPQR